MNSSKRTAVIISVCMIIAGLIICFAALCIWNFDFSKLNSLGESEMKVYDIADDFKSIDMRDVECDTVLLPSSDGKCRIECSENKNIVHSVEVSDGVLKIRRNDFRRWYEHIGFMWWNNMSLTVYLPKSEYDTLYLETVSGNITVPENISFGSVEVRSTSGNISFSAVSKNGIWAKTVSGDINIKNTAGGKAEVQSTSGNIYLENMKVDDIIVKTTSGKAELNSFNADWNTEIYSTSGDVRLKDSDAGTFIIKTVSGSVRGTVKSPKNFKTATTSGRVYVPIPDTSSGLFDVKTTSGDIEISVE